MNTLVILAGGKSSRMGNDKTFLPYQGTTFLGHLLQKADGIFDQVLISAGSREHGNTIDQWVSKNPLLCPGLQPEIVIDCYDSIGPMGGLLSIFEQTRLEEFAAVAVDLPEAAMPVLAALLERCRQFASIQASRQMDLQPDLYGTYSERQAPVQKETAAVMFTFHSGHIETCAAAYNRRAYALLKQAMEQNVHSLVRALGMEHIDLLTPADIQKLSPAFAELNFEQSFQNINTAEEFQALRF